MQKKYQGLLSILNILIQLRFVVELKLNKYIKLNYALLERDVENPIHSYSRRHHTLTRPQCFRVKNLSLLIILFDSTNSLQLHPWH